MWVSWIWKYLIKKGSFWSVKNSSTKGSWMWRKLLKYRELAKDLYRVDIKNGSSTSFWFDNWSPLGRLFERTGPHGAIDMGIPLDATVETVMGCSRRRRHRVDIFNQIEAEIRCLFTKDDAAGNDIPLWKFSANTFKRTFSTKGTWNLIRTTNERVDWYKGVWFPYATPKYSFLMWLALHDRLSTGDRLKLWNSGQQVTCILCGTREETRCHLFFSCIYSAAIWTTLTQGLLGTDFSLDWNQLITTLCNRRYSHLHIFLIRYAFQSTLYHIWRERNARRHGAIPTSQTQLTILIDKNVRNRLSSIRSEGDQRYVDGLQLWFATRLST